MGRVIDGFFLALVLLVVFVAMVVTGLICVPIGVAWWLTLVLRGEA